MRLRIHTILFLIVSLCCAACERTPEDRQIEVLRIGVLPDQSRTVLKTRFTPLLAYLQQELGIKTKLILVDDYQDLLQRFHNKELDLVRFGGFSFVKAHLMDQASPLVMRDIDARFVSYFLVQANSKARAVADFKGKVFAFGARLSTSGHLMPRYFLQQQKIKPESFFSEVRYSGAHDLTAQWVASGQVDIGVANAVVINRLYQEQKLSKKKVRILSQTPPYADYVWAAQADLPAELQHQIVEAFLKLTHENPEHTKLLRAVGAGAYLPASTNDFASLERVARGLNLLNAEGEPKSGGY